MEEEAALAGSLEWFSTDNIDDPIIVILTDYCSLMQCMRSASECRFLARTLTTALLAR